MTGTNERDHPQPAYRFETRTVHAGAEPDPTTGAVIPAIEMSTMRALDAAFGLKLDPVTMALTGRRAENEWISLSLERDWS